MIRTEIPTPLFVIIVAVLLAIMLAGCGTTVSFPVAQPNLQTINLGQSNCHWDCHTTHTATQSLGDNKTGDVTGATVSNTSGDRSRSTSLGAGQ